MSAYWHWVKPLGVIEPERSLVPDDWLSERSEDGAQSLDVYRIRSGPPEYRRPPEPGPHQRIFLHAVGHSLTFGEGELLTYPEERGSFGRWGMRWPWGYDVRIDHWVPLVPSGMPSRDLFPQRAIGRIQVGAEFAGITRSEYEAALARFRSWPDVQSRGD